MTTDSFHDSLSAAEPPAALAPSLRALWLDRKGDWDRAHVEVQDGDTPADCQVHGYLHRKEGDAENAAYWYRRAGTPVAQGPLDAEWETLLRQLLPA